MVDRRDLGSWLQGPGASSERGSAYPGERLGRPETGPRSIAGPARRFAGLMIDWLLCATIARGILGPEALQPNGSLSVVAVLVIVNMILVSAAGATFGHRVVGVQVEGLDGGRLGVGRSAVRAVLLGLGFPPITLLWEQDRRGLHELASGSLVAIRGRG